jgi:protein-tyrosine phosphatase
VGVYRPLRTATREGIGQPLRRMMRSCRTHVLMPPRLRYDGSMAKGKGPEVRTSVTHPIQVNWLPFHKADRVGLTFAPGKKGSSIYGYRWDRDLAADLEVLAKEHGVQTLVTLMELHELVSSQIPKLIELTRKRQIFSIHFPIPDLGIPSNMREVDALLDQIEQRLASGERVAIHCLGGIGRTGTIATALLLRRGMQLAEAIEIVRETRCKAFPESNAQKQFVADYSIHVEKRPSSRRQEFAAASRTGKQPTGVPLDEGQSSGAPACVGLPWALLGTTEIKRESRSPLARQQVCDLLGVIEGQVKSAPHACFAVGADGNVTLQVKDRSYHAGRFEVATLATLKERTRATQGSKSGRIRLSVLRGTDPLTDIGTLQATAPDATLFQVASQFNCLEAPANRLVPIRDYPHDSTQGPRASVSAFPGTFLRHYFAPRENGERFVQTDSDNLNLLSGAVPSNVARLKSGYLTSDLVSDMKALAKKLEENFDQIRIGMHDQVEVTLGANWGGVVEAPNQRIAQVFTSTIALGGYSRDDGSTALASVQAQLLRAAYLGTLLGALALQKQTVVLTLIGGGAFGNSHRAIWDAIHWAIIQAEPNVPGILDVVVNARSDTVDTIDLDRATGSGGQIIEITAKELRVGR